MTARRSLRDLERQCKKEPDNVVVRLLLAAALREAGRSDEAFPLYRSVADVYLGQGRRTQAIAVLKSLIEIDGDPGTRSLVDRLEQETVRTIPPSAPWPGVPELSTEDRDAAWHLTPTPLPAPVPFHEDGDVELHEPQAAVTHVADVFRPPSTGHTPPPLPPVEWHATGTPAPRRGRLTLVGRSTGVRRSTTFAGSFGVVLDQLDPDGATIEAPLDVTADALAELCRHTIVRHHAAGDVILREGELGDACYVIVDGEVRVLKDDPLAPDAAPVEVARLGAGSLFGEFALLADRRRHATVEATSPVRVHEIPHRLLREQSAIHPDVGSTLDAFYRQRLLATLLRTARFFQPIPAEERVKLLGRFVPLRAETGESIVREGQAADGLYLIILGAVEITRRLDTHRTVFLETLREGAHFGETSLVSGEPAAAAVVAAGPVELALLPPWDFYDVMLAYPDLWTAIRRDAHARALEHARSLAGETGAVHGRSSGR